jgi:rubrerythrin
MAIALGVIGLAISPIIFAESPDLKVGTTLENLQAAFNGESNAHARYLDFAKKAEEEGLNPVASLFRAAAKAEEIHAVNHKKVIESMGGTAEAMIEKPVVKSTKENLAAAIAGESYERDVMYVEFLKVAKTDRNRQAMRTLNLAKIAEAEHAKLYQGALDNLDAWKGDAKIFYVCTVCGYTTTDPSLEKCPSCFSPKEKFIRVS